VIWFVVDVSVAAKWVLRGPEEDFVPQARQLLLQIVEGRIQAIVPDLFWVELGNVLWNAVRRGRCTRLTAESGIREVKQQGLLTSPSLGLLEVAFDIAIRFNRTVYDSMYVALASTRGAQLVTADEKLAKAVAAHFPVRWLGAPVVL
jgi:predicted nucleic acid-binding protein